ncbi:4'-phosphopantetheinyl transferase superfamily [Radiomyces spectabilis]|uniref:4'-phosphopantetheinyl transferase superfamily n=1 Tax=Radiomyces spectabilis TaxID=64574 RepID=UPI0022204B34|nr:4'-phosphopantetheinyl transferase superfamily [Radiomyces spectabilis]KAI8368321.1 4'-phosphopantetheinyl transferase superfamily [Radiomyces spectabilis]
MILGIGIDLVHVPRIASLIARRGFEGLARRVLSDEEMSVYRKQFIIDGSKVSMDKQNALHQKQIMFLASRWSMKEAVYKALYPVHKLEWKQKLVWFSSSGKPTLHVMHGEKFGIRRSHVSLSHDGEYIVAQVILES